MLSGHTLLADRYAAGKITMKELIYLPSVEAVE
jgi:hypothetical protein